MKVINLGERNSVIGKYIAELRNVKLQNNRLRFRNNLLRIGHAMAYEVSRTLDFSKKKVQTPLGISTVNTYDNRIVLGTVLRAGLAFHEGFLDVFDEADCAFVSAYRDENEEGFESLADVGVHVDYLAAPNLDKSSFLLIDPMLATGSSLDTSYRCFIKNGMPSKLDICVVIAAQPGIDYLQKIFPSDDVTLWCATVDQELNSKAYIVPGLGDAGDLSFGEKL